MDRRYLVKERLSEFSQLPPEQVFSKLKISASGLNDEQVEESKKDYGQNLITKKTKDTIIYRLRRAIMNPFSIILLFLAVISFCTDVIFSANFSRNITSTLIMLSMLVVSVVIRFSQEMRSKVVTDRLNKLVNTTVRVRRNNNWEEIDGEELVVGDVVSLSPGDRVPADIRLVKTTDFFVSQSVITGESGILEKTADAISNLTSSICKYSNMIFMGSVVIGGRAEGIVLAVGCDTVYGNAVPNEAIHKRGFDKGENSISWVLIKFMVILVPIVFLACGLTKGNWFEVFLFSVSVAVCLTPEMLPMVVAACLTKGTYQMGQKKVVVKTANAMQSLGSMDILCVDKTGTLTDDKVKLEYYMDILGNTCHETLDYAFLNSAYSTGVLNHLDKAILVYKNLAEETKYFANLVERYKKLDEMPFDYNRKFNSVLIEKNEEKLLVVKGNVENVAKRCKYVLYKGERMDMGDEGIKNVHNITDRMMQDGMKVLAVATKNINSSTISTDDEFDMTLIGYLAFFDVPKKSASEAIANLKKQNVSVKVLSGDNKDVTVSVCRRLGIPVDEVITGTTLETINDNDLPLFIENCSVFAELSPNQKANIVKILQESCGHSVGFMGDGMNDLPAVIQADVGISVNTATDSIKDCSDVILLKKDLNVLSEGISEGRKAFTNMSKYIKITASSNFGNICTIVIASIFLPFFPMITVQLLLLNLLYDILCLVLPWDNVDEELIQKPRAWSGRELSRFMLFFGSISSIFDILTFIFLYFVLCPAICGGAYHTLTIGKQFLFISMFQTGWFLESMWSQVLILHLLRTKQIPFVQSKPSKPVVIITAAGILLFSVLPMTSLGALYNMSVMPVWYFIFLILIVFLYLSSVT
ncbi:MAG: magnesium-translocating P-type ATPase, partial [Candidatus Gastranaerophilales bacterium]|nr:magnesium-translocating P-type ATPase [Candidatus Gastranaerophilales bacterium]